MTARNKRFCNKGVKIPINHFCAKALEGNEIVFESKSRINICFRKHIQKMVTYRKKILMRAEAKGVRGFSI